MHPGHGIRSVPGGKNRARQAEADDNDY